MNLLTQTSAMPCKSFSLPARVTCPGSRPGICSDCYAMKGFYPLSSSSRLERLQWTRAALENGTFVPTLTELIRGMPFFRIHDSGDFFSVPYIEAWTAIARALPETRFWAPTRSYLVPGLLPALRALASLPNVAIRPSAIDFEDDVPEIPGLAAGTSSSSFMRSCRKVNGRCGPCRLCWDKTGSVVYARH